MVLKVISETLGGLLALMLNALHAVHSNDIAFFGYGMLKTPEVLRSQYYISQLKKFLKQDLDLCIRGGGYKTADLFQSADLKLNIEKIDLPDQSQGTVICNHVLEHVDDKKALQELFRVLDSDGVLILSVPIIEGWETTYENSEISLPENRELYFGQNDHVRFYGRDFRDRLSEAGFDFLEVTAEGDDVIKYGLWRGEKFFICKKSA